MALRLANPILVENSVIPERVILSSLGILCDYL